MKTLRFETAGMSGTNKADVENCRLRTRIENNKGRLIYLEIGGMERSKYSVNKVFDNHGRVDHCFYSDIAEDLKRNYSKELAPIQHLDYEYNRANILKLVNEKLDCSFDNIEVSEDLRVHDTDKALCSSK